MRVTSNSLLGVIKYGYAVNIPQNRIFGHLFGQRNLSISSWYLNVSNAGNNSKTKSDTPSNWGTRKPHRKIKLNFPLDASDPKTVNILEPLRIAVKEQVWFI